MSIYVFWERQRERDVGWIPWPDHIMTWDEENQELDAQPAEPPRPPDILQIDLMFLRVQGSFQKENEELKKPLGSKADSHFYIKNNELRGCHQTKGLGLGAVTGGGDQETLGKNEGEGSIILVGLFV